MTLSRCLSASMNVSWSYLTASDIFWIFIVDAVDLRRLHDDVGVQLGGA